jgi:hypothetical protein
MTAELDIIKCIENKNEEKLKLYCSSNQTERYPKILCSCRLNMMGVKGYSLSECWDSILSDKIPGEFVIVLTSRVWIMDFLISCIQCDRHLKECGDLSKIKAMIIEYVKVNSKKLYPIRNSIWIPENFKEAIQKSIRSYFPFLEEEKVDEFKEYRDRLLKEYGFEKHSERLGRIEKFLRKVLVSAKEDKRIFFLGLMEDPDLFIDVLLSGIDEKDRKKLLMMTNFLHKVLVDYDVKHKKK